MNRKTLIVAAVVALSSTFAIQAAEQGATPSKERVAFQVSDGNPGTWTLALNAANNVLKAFGPGKVDIEIVVYGQGIGMLKADAVISNRIADGAKAGMNIVACENTMQGLKLTQADMNPVIGYVPAGVVELMKRQSEGWAYIRP